jgi:carotenoid 1,2-hydratase
VEVDLDMPSLRWCGHGYFDTNSGAVPLQDCFRDWHWSRRHQDGATHVTYQTRDRADRIAGLALRIDDSGHIDRQDLPPVRQLPRGLWRMPRPIAAHAQTQVIETLEDAPFYTRSVVRSADHGDALTMHESLSLDQFVKPWVQRLLPFRTRRNAQD